MKLTELPEIEREIYWICLEPKTVHEIFVELKKFSISYINNICNILIARKLMTKFTTTTRRTLYHSIPIKRQEDETPIQEMQ